MKKITFIILFQIIFSFVSFGQSFNQFADSIRKADSIPEIAYAIVTSDSILTIGFSGYHSINLPDTASPADRFHIGSNTKAMTAFIIAKYVEKNKLKWNTKFFTLFPDWKMKSNKAYYNITLEQLLSHRARIQPFTEDKEGEILPKFTGTKQQKRKAFCKYALTLDPVAIDTTLPFIYSNAGYSIAALMLEKASGKSWEELIQQVFNKDLKISTQFSWPENQSRKDTWGHLLDSVNNLVPQPSTISYNLDYFEPAGDINITLADYIKFIQLNINGLKGKNNYLKSKTYTFIHKGIDNYSMGWGNIIEGKKSFSSHSGSAGTYVSNVIIDRNTFTAYIVFTNSATDKTMSGIRMLMRKLRGK